MIKELANVLVQAATARKFKVEVNPEFTDAMKKIEAEERNLATRIYDSGTMFIVDDEQHVVIPKLVVHRK